MTIFVHYRKCFRVALGELILKQIWQMYSVLCRFGFDVIYSSVWQTKVQFNICSNWRLNFIDSINKYVVWVVCFCSLSIRLFQCLNNFIWGKYWIYIRKYIYIIFIFFDYLPLFEWKLTIKILLTLATCYSIPLSQYLYYYFVRIDVLWIVRSTSQQITSVVCKSNKLQFKKHQHWIKQNINKQIVHTNIIQSHND